MTATITEQPPVPMAGKLALLASIVGMMTSLVAIFLGTFPLFLEPVSNAMRWNRATFPGMLMAVALCGAVLGPFIGRAVDRLGARPVALTGILLWGIGLILLSGMGPSLPYRIAAIVLLGLGGGFAGQLVFAHIVSRWFTANRGLTLGLTLGVAPALAQALAAPAMRFVIGREGWRTAYLVLGVFVLIVTLLTNFLFLREPAAATVSDDHRADTAPGETAGAAVASLRFWIVTLSITACSFVYNGIFAHSVAILSAKGISSAISTAFVSITALAGLPSPVLAGLLLDKAPSPRWAVLPFLASVLLGSVLIAWCQGAISVILGAVLCGLSVGAGPALQPFVLSRYFGERAQSEIFGISLLPIIGGTAAGPLVMGLLFDRLGNYTIGLLVFQLVAGGAVLLAMALPGYRYSRSGAGV